MLITVSEAAYKHILDLANEGGYGFGACEECSVLIMEDECPQVAATEERFLCSVCAAKVISPQAQ